MPRPGNWRNGGCESSALSAGVVGAARAATPTGAACLKRITAAAIAAVFPAAGTGTALATATAGITAAAAAALTVTPAIAIAATAVVATAPVTTPTAATGGAAARLSLVDPQGAAHQLGTLEAIDGPVFHLGIRHLHEGEAALAAGVTLERKRAVRHLSKGRKQLCHVFLLCTEGQIADKNAHEPGRPRGRSMRAPGPQIHQA